MSLEKDIFRAIKANGFKITELIEDCVNELAQTIEEENEELEAEPEEETEDEDDTIFERRGFREVRDNEDTIFE